MNFLDHISFANLSNQGFNAIQFSILGMLIVFGGLAFISIYIALLPKLLALPAKMKERAKRRRVVGTAKEPEEKEAELLLAIAIALHLEKSRPGDNLRITWQRHDELEPVWRTAGIMQGLAVRSNISRNR